MCSAELREKFQEVANKYGYKLGAMLGSGGYAMVFEVTNTVVHNVLVMKFTRDDRDYRAANEVIKAQNRGEADSIVRIYATDVLPMKRVDTWSGKAYDCSYYALISERLDLPQKATDCPSEYRITVEPTRNFLIRNLYGADSYAEFANLWKRIASYMDWNILGHMESMEQANIAIVDDWKYDNVMMRGDKIVLSDLGCSKLSPRIQQAA